VHHRPLQLQRSQQLQLSQQLRTLALLVALSRSCVSSVMRCVAHENLRSVPATAAPGLRWRGGEISRELVRSSAEQQMQRMCMFVGCSVLKLGSYGCSSCRGVCFCEGVLVVALRLAAYVGAGLATRLPSRVWAAADSHMAVRPKLYWL
jgi:hypothetical protein